MTYGLYNFNLFIENSFFSPMRNTIYPARFHTLTILISIWATQKKFFKIQFINHI